MFPSLRKLSQQAKTIRTVSTIPSSCSEPKHPTSFANLQFQAQVLHVCSPRRSNLLASLMFFSGRMGSLSRCEVPTLPAKGLPAQSVQCRPLFVGVQSGLSYPGKVPLPPVHLFHSYCGRPSFRISATGYVPERGTESLKVIAFDNHDVNSNLRHLQRPVSKHGMQSNG